MNTQPLFSLVLYVDQPESFQTALDALLHQKRFLSSGQLIVAAPEDTAELRAAFNACAKGLAFKPTLLVLPGCSAPQAYNAGLDNAAGSWINFSLSSASLSPNTFAALDRAIQNHDTISAFSLRPVYVGFGANLSSRRPTAICP